MVLSLFKFCREPILDSLLRKGVVPESGATLEAVGVVLPESPVTLIDLREDLG